MDENDIRRDEASGSVDGDMNGRVAVDDETGRETTDSVFYSNKPVFFLCLSTFVW